MKGFFKFIISLLGVFAAVIGALTVFDKLLNKNRLQGDYLKCEDSDKID